MRIRKPSKRTMKKMKLWSIFIGKILLTLLIICAASAIICGIVFAIYVNKYIDPKIDIEVEALKLNYSSIVYYVDENGGEHELERLYNVQNRTWVDLSDIPENLINAAIAIEDERFEKHHGVDWKRTAGAALNLFFKMRSDFGGSTITQQLIKNLTGDKQDTVNRKIQEIMRALYLERHYSKDTIMEFYLNTIYLGQGCYGVQTASETYFGKDVKDLSLAECASLIGITNLPTYYDPFINPDNNKKRQQAILKKMLKLRKITKEEYEDALALELTFNHEKRTEDILSKQSYYVDQVIEDVIRDLIKERGYSYQVAERMIFSGGLKIYSAIDPDIQNAMDEVFKNDANFPKYKSSVQPECAMVVMDPYTGRVLGLVGGRGEKNSNRILNRATQTYRPPGSSIKPLAVYAPAIEYGLINPQSPVDDAPIRVYRGSPYPKNETRVYSGRISILKGLMDSLNTASMRTLEKLTPRRSYNFLTANLGFTSLDAKRDINPAPLSLGALTKGVSVLEMTAAYCVFPNDGIYIEPHTYTKVLDSQDRVLLEKEPGIIDAMSVKTSAYMNYMLQKVISGGTGTYAKLKRGMPAAGKTGTTDNDQDRWFVGYTPYYAGAVWFGYDKPQYISKSLSPALTTWKKVMDIIHENLEIKKFKQPDGFVYVDVCSCSGLLPTKECLNDPRGSQVTRGYFHREDVPTKYCNLHVAVEIDSATNMLATEHCPVENRKTVSLLHLERYFPVSGVVLGDEQFTLREYTETGELKTPPQGMFYYSPPANAPAYNRYCTVHTAPPVPEPPQEQDTEQPEDESPDDYVENPDTEVSEDRETTENDTE